MGNQAPYSDSDDLRGTVNNDNKGRCQFEILSEQHVERFSGEVGIDMPGPQINDPDVRFERLDDQRAEVTVMGEDDSILRSCEANQVDIRRAEQPAFLYVENVKT